MGALEKKLLTEIQLYASKKGARLFRANTGMGWQGNTTGPVKQRTQAILNPGDAVLRNARPFHAGFPKGTSDLIGFTRITITKELVGREIAVFTAVEAKTTNVRATTEQRKFIDAVLTLGGIATIARKKEHYKEAIIKFLGGLNENRMD